MSFREFVEGYFVPNFFPTLKRSTQDRYRRTLNNHLLPAFGRSGLCDIGTLELQRFVLQKLASGLGWECADHYRNLMSKVFATAKQWGYFPGDNPAIGVGLPEKKAVREKHVLLPEQIPPLLAILGEPVNTMVLLGVLTGLRIGETFGTSMEVCKLCLRRDSGRTGLLSGLDRLSQDQKQQTHTSSAGGALDGVEASAGAIRRVNAREPRTPGARPLRSADRLSKGHKAIVRCPATTVLLPGHRCAPVPKCHLSARCDWPIPSVFALSSRTILNENCKCA